MEPLQAAFIEQMESILGQEQEAFLRTIEGASPISIRLNPLKSYDPPFKLDAPIPWTSAGYYLAQRPSFTLDPGFHGGAYYVQEASSMLIEAAIKANIDLSQPLKVLDLCAAPGGKSTLLASILHPDSLLVTNEVIQSRYRILIENMHKWGTSNTFITNHDVSDFTALKGFFDIILVDAPCSGEGMFRKDPASRKEWSISNVQLCAGRQKRILGAVEKLLAPSGLLLYSTCTYNQQENEENAAWLIENFDLETCAFEPDSSWGLRKLSYGYQAFPHVVKGEGFYLSIFKASNHRSPFKFKAKQKLAKGLDFIPHKSLVPIQPFIENMEEWIFFTNHLNEVCMLPKVLKAEMQLLSQVLYRYYAGRPVGTLKGKQLIPHHAFALANQKNPELPQIALDHQDALRFLKKEALPNHASSPLGWTIMTYKGIALGWGKVLKDRINNNLPKNLRIRMKID